MGVGVAGRVYYVVVADYTGIIFNTRVAGGGVRWVLARGGLSMGSGRVAVSWDVLAYCVPSRAERRISGILPHSLGLIGVGMALFLRGVGCN